VALRVPQRGDKRSLMETVARNAARYAQFFQRDVPFVVAEDDA